MEELAICAIVKNEALYIHEWLSYHYAQGVRRFVLYDNASTDDTRAIIERWTRRDTVTVVSWPQANGQIDAYRDMLVRFRNIAEWCAFIDCDEFLCPQSSLSTIDVLRQIGRGANGLYAHWWMFGSSGHAKRQSGLVTETFRLRAPDAFGSHFFGKSIMRLAAVTNVGTHVFSCNGRMVNDSDWQIDKDSAGTQVQKSHRLLALNHYFTKSHQEWQERRSLGRADKPTNDAEFRRPDSEFLQHDINAILDNRAALFMQAARAMFYLEKSFFSQSVLTKNSHLVTIHGTVLCWNYENQSVVHVPLTQIPSNYSVLVCDLVNSEGPVFRLSSSNNAVEIDGASEFTVSFGSGKALHFCATENFLCAEGESKDVHVNRKQAGEWETFFCVPPEYLASFEVASLLSDRQFT